MELFYEMKTVLKLKKITFLEKENMQNDDSFFRYLFLCQICCKIIDFIKKMM